MYMKGAMMMNTFLLMITTLLFYLSLFNPQVHGIVRRSSSFNTGRIEHLYKNPQAHIEGSKTLFLYLTKNPPDRYTSLFSACTIYLIYVRKKNDVFSLTKMWYNV